MLLRRPWYRSGPSIATIGWLAWLASCLVCNVARAGDGIYDRMDGDLVLSAGLGAGMTTRGGARGIGIAELEALYLDSAGTVLSFEHLGDQVGLAWGVKIRPLFLARFFAGSWTGSNRVDLWIDSWALEMGSWLGPWQRGLGAAWWLGTSFDLPLGTMRSGFHLRLATRYVQSEPDWLGSPQGARGGLRLMAALVYAGLLDMGVAAPARDQR